MVEVDVRLTKDRCIVVFHDETVERTSNGRGYVNNMTLEEIKQLDVGKGERVPTLEEVILAAKDKSKLVVELKEPPVVEKAVQLVENLGVDKEVLLTSFYHPAVRRVKELAPQIKTGVIFTSEPVRPSQLALNANSDALFPNYRYVTQRMVDDAHGNGLSVFVWTVDSREAVKYFIARGVDGIVTNRPDLLVSPAKCKKLG